MSLTSVGCMHIQVAHYPQDLVDIDAETDKVLNKVEELAGYDGDRLKTLVSERQHCDYILGY
jgi:hypothetical protein